MMARARAALPHPAIVLVTDSRRRQARDQQGEEWIDDVVREAVLGGVNVVQLREKHLQSGELIARGLHVRDAIAGRALLFVNGNVEAAAALAADGVHLPEDGPPIDEVRGRVGETMLISRAVHSLDAAVSAEREGADVLQLGTIFETPSKPGVTPLGIDGLREVCASVSVPVIAIGGITPRNAGDVLRAGAAGIAVIGAIFDAGDPRIAARELSSAVAASTAVR